MDIYEKYASYRQQIEALTEQMKELEPQLLSEIEHEGESLKTMHGTFARVGRKYYTLSEEGQAEVKHLKEHIKMVEKREIDEGKAEEKLVVSLRYTKPKK